MRHIYSCSLLIASVLFSMLGKAQYRSLEFIENKGQWDGPHAFMASTEVENIYFQKNAFTYTLSDPKNIEYIKGIKSGTTKDGTVFKYHTYRINFLGANDNCEIIANKKQSHYYNYFLGNDQTKWQSEIHPARVLDYKSLYPGIDMHLSSETHSLKYEFIVAAGADVSKIRLQYEGQEKLLIKNGNLVIKTSVEEVKELKPYTYQLVNGEKTEIPCEYKIEEGNIVTYNFPKGYDKSSLLVIDPTVVFATFTGASADNWGFTATYDNAGNFYAGGIVHYMNTTNSFPTSTGAFQSVYMGGTNTSGSQYACDMVLFKYNAPGTAYMFATFLGGTDNDQPHSLIVDANNNLIVAGRTYSSNFPISANAYDPSFNGQADIVISKISANGTALLGSTFLGGSGDDGVNEFAPEFTPGILKHNYGDDARSEVIIDNAGNIYIAAATASTNFPTVNAYQSSLQGGQDGIIAKLNGGLTSLLWSTYLGGSTNDAAYVLSLNRQQSHVYVAGGTTSSNFPSTFGSYRSSYQGGTTDGFIGRFVNGGNYGLDKMTFIGTAGYDQCYGIQVDNDNSVYAMGQTLGGTFPVNPSSIYFVANSSQFVIKMDSFLVNNIYSTVFGSGASNVTNISPVAFLVDTCQNVYISGWGGNPAGGSTNFFPGTGNTFNMPLTPNAAQSTTDGNDFYFIVMAKNTLLPLYGSYMGGNGAQEHVDGGTSRFDKAGVVYQAICGGCGGSSNFPTTAGSVSTVNGSTNCNLVAVKIAFELGAVNAKAGIKPDSIGCAPFTVHFSNGSTNATSYQWDFGDNTSSTLDTPSHTYTTAGNFTVRMIAYNPNACKERDTVFMHVTVLNTGVNPNFNFNKVDSCGPYTGNFVNTSTTAATGPSTYFWDFGDGTTSTLQNPPLHVFPDTGCYNVMLVMNNPNACNSPDTIIKKICYIDVDVTAGFTMPDSLCINTKFTVNNTSKNAQTYSWNFGDGNTSTVISPTHTYTAPGTYTVRLIVNNPAGCVPRDTFSKQVFVSDNYVDAKFNYKKIDTCDPFSASFENISVFGTTSGAHIFTKFLWNFGDGSTSNLATPGVHTFPDTGCYDVRLIMIDTTSCNSPDTFIQKVCFNAAIVRADFKIPDSVCLNDGVLFANRSTNATSTFWNFGDGTTSTVTSPVHVFQKVGTYTVMLISGNPTTCNKFDTATAVITIDPLPVANFVHQPITPIANEPISFTNRSQNATSYIWSFGDGTGSSDVHPKHMYKKTAQYLVCLVAKDAQGCVDTVCKRVDALIIPAVDVPTAFSPNADGKNDILFIYGAAIETVHLKIYNRWGQMVFETKSMERGWDGTYNGKPQEMDSYAYTLVATFFDGTSASKDGNVTLLR
jgi:gliding motility-associated-like protein